MGGKKKGIEREKKKKKRGSFRDQLSPAGQHRTFTSLQITELWRFFPY
jgi:hypothetical protein